MATIIPIPVRKQNHQVLFLTALIVFSMAFMSFSGSLFVFSENKLKIMSHRRGFILKVSIFNYLYYQYDNFNIFSVQLLLPSSLCFAVFPHKTDNNTVVAERH